MVAGCPDSSASRFAARPVGAASTIFARFAAASVIDRPDGERLPAARPAGQHRHLLRSAPAAPPAPAPAASSAPVRPRSQASALSQSTPAKAGSRSAGVVRAAAAGRRPARSRRGGTAPDTPPGSSRPPVPGRGPARGPPPRSAASSARQARPARRAPRRICRGVGDQVRLGQVAVPVVGGLGQGVLEAGLHPLRAVVRDPDRLGDRVGGLEPDPPHVGGQPVRLVPHHRDRARRRTSCRSAPPARWTPRRPAGRPSPP